MSRRTGELNVMVVGFEDGKAQGIMDAVQRQWRHVVEWAESCHGEERWMTGRSTVHLVGGEDEGEMSNRVARSVWKANGAFCRVAITFWNEDYQAKSWMLDQQQYSKLGTWDLEENELLAADWSNLETREVFAAILSSQFIGEDWRKRLIECEDECHLQILLGNAMESIGMSYGSCAVEVRFARTMCERVNWGEVMSRLMALREDYDFIEKVGEEFDDSDEEKDDIPF